MSAIETISNVRTLRSLVIASGVLLVSATVALFASARQSAMVLASIVGTAFTLAAARWPAFGLGALIVAGLVVPGGVGTGTHSELNATVLLLPVLLVLWLADRVGRRELRLLPSRPLRPLLAFAAVAVVAFAAGSEARDPFVQVAPLRAQIGALAVILLSIGAFVLFAHRVTSVRMLERLTWSFIALGGAYVVGRTVPALREWADAILRSGADGSLFWTWLVALAFAQAVFHRSLPLRWRVLLMAVVVAALSVGLLQARWWASGWLPPLIAVAASLLAGAPRVAVPIVALGVAVAALNFDFVVDLVMVGDQRYSLMTRTEALSILARIITDHPLLGVGPANYYFYTPSYPILGWYVHFSSHNNYVDIAAQTGSLGLFCFLWFVVEIGRLGWTLRRRVPNGFPRAYVLGALGGLAGTLAAAAMADWFLPFVYNVGLAGLRASILGWLFLGGLVSLEHIHAPPRASTPR